MSFFNDLFSKTKQIISSGKEGLNDAFSTEVTYDREKDEAQRNLVEDITKQTLSNAYKYGKTSDPTTYGIRKDPVPTVFGLNLPTGTNIPPNIGNTAETTAPMLKKPISVLDEVVKGAELVATEGPEKALETTQAMGQGMWRGFAAVGTGLEHGRAALMNPVGRLVGAPEIKPQPFRPRGTFQETLYGTKEAIDTRSFAGEFGIPEDSKYAPYAGFILGGIDALGGGSKSIIIKRIAKSKDLTKIGGWVNDVVPNVKQLPKDDLQVLIKELSKESDPKKISGLINTTNKWLADTNKAPKAIAEMKNMHEENLQDILDFTDAVRLGDEPTVENSIRVRTLAERFGISPEQPDAELAKILRSKLDKEENLIVMHNLTGSNVDYTVDKMGGQLPVPSIAISRREFPLENFGEISLITDKHMVDPRLSSKTKAFNTDVYSKRFPQTTHLVKDSKPLKALVEDIKPYFYYADTDSYKRSDYRLLDSIENDGIAALRNSELIQEAYAKQKGLPRSAKEEAVTKTWRTKDGGWTPGFTEYVNEVYDSLKIREGIFDQKHYYNTAQTRYKEATLDNFVKELKGDPRATESTSYGVPTLRASGAKKFNNLTEIKKDRGKVVNPSEVDDLKQATTDEFYELSNKYKVESDDNLISNLIDYNRNKISYEELVEYTRLSETAVDDFIKFTNKLKELPAGYFEVKPQRAVDLSEFKIAVVPKSTQADTIKRLREKGLKIVRYNDNDPKDRARVIRATVKQNELAFGAVGGVEIDEDGKMSIDPLKAAAGVAGVGALKKSGAIKKVDELIAAGKIRVMSKDGRDIYQVKKGNKWFTRRDEDSAVNFFKPKKTTPKVKPTGPKPQQSPAYQEAFSSLDAELSYAMSGLKETGENYGKVRFTSIPAWIPEEFRDAKLMRTALKYLDEGIVPKKGSHRVEGAMETIKDEIKDRMAKISKYDKYVEENPLPVVSKKKPTPVKPVEVKSLEQAAGKTLDGIPPKVVSQVKTLEEIITQTPVSKKINALDYIRTPDRILEKIGLGNESKFLRKKYDDYVKELPVNLDIINEWYQKVPKSGKKLFQYLDGKDVKLTPQEMEVAVDMRVYLQGWAKRLGLPEDKAIKNYITHLFDDQLIAKEFDEDLAKLIADKIPGEVYNPFLQKRLGAKGYKEDVWKALDAYTKRATRKVHLDPALTKLRDKAGSSLEFSNLEKSQFKYVQNYIDRVNMRPTDIDNLIDNAVKSVFGYKIGGRPALTMTRALRRMTYRGFLGLNVSSALRNMSQGINTYATLGEKYTVIGYTKLFGKNARAELVREGVFASNFIEDRAISATKKAIEKLDKGIWFMFDSVEKMNRGSAYFGAKAKGLAEGMSEADAITYAKKIVRKTQFAYDAVDTPALLAPDVLKTMFQFQTFTTKQIEFLSELVKNKDFKALTRYTIAGLAFVYTIGKAFGMDPKELLPWYRFGVPPSLELPAEVTKAVLGTEDQFGNERDLETKVKDVAESGVGLIPAGSQLKKTYEGSQAIREGGVYNDGGKLQFPQGQTGPEKLQSLLFGKYASNEANAYFKKVEVQQERAKDIKGTYEDVQKLIEEGNEIEAGNIIDSLSDEDYQAYKTHKSQAKREATAELAKDIMPTYLEIQELAKSGNEKQAQTILDSLTDEEYKAYESVKKSVAKNKADMAERSAIGTVGAYARAFFIDPGNAWKALTTDEELGKVKGELVEMKRFYGRDYTASNGSEAYIYEQLKLMGIDEDDRSNYRLEHIVPVGAGGDSSPENLKVVPKDEHESYTSFDIRLGNAVKDNRLTRKQASKIARDYKSGAITEEEALNMIK